MTRYLIVLAAMLGACQQPPANVATDEGPDVTPDPDPIPRVAGVHFAESRQAAESDQFQEEFKLLGQTDIVAAIDFQVSDLPADDEDGVHIVLFRVLNAQAAGHHSSWSAFTTDPSGPDSVMHPIGRGTVQVQHISEKNGWLRLYSAIPIAGSNFTRHHLSGLFYGEAKLGLPEDAKILTNTLEITKD